MHDTAQILVHDTKFGGRAQDRAIRYGDAILPVIVTESGNFERLNSRNGSWIAEVLGNIKTERSESLARDLYARSDALPHLVGAVALAERGKLDSERFADLITTVTEDRNESNIEFAMLALGKAHAVMAGPILVKGLSKRAGDYWRDAYACDAIARIGYKEAVPTLQFCMRSQDFYALPNAFRALISLGDREAVPLAISRVSPEIERYNTGYVVKELEKVTGRHFGYNRDAWLGWWRTVEHEWSIPAQFRKPYDSQPQVY